MFVLSAIMFVPFHIWVIEWGFVLAIPAPV